MSLIIEHLTTEKKSAARKTRTAITRLKEDLDKLERDITAWENGESAASEFRVNSGNVSDVMENAAAFKTAANALAIAERS